MLLLRPLHRLRSSRHHLYETCPARGETVIVPLTLIRQEYLTRKLSDLFDQHLVFLVCQCCWDRVNYAGECCSFALQLNGLEGALFMPKIEHLVRVFEDDCAVCKVVQSILRVRYTAWITYYLVANVSTAVRTLVQGIVRGSDTIAIKGELESGSSRHTFGSPDTCLPCSEIQNLCSD